MEYSNNEGMLDELEQLILNKGHGEAVEHFIFFARHYFSESLFDELENRASEDLYGAILSHWNLFLSKPSQENSVRIYNPNIEEHGWQSTHTVIELVVLDKPFVLQSITMEINRHGFANQLLSDVVFWSKRDIKGKLLSLSVTETQGQTCECVLHLEIERISEHALIEQLTKNIQSVLADVNAVTSDWSACLTKIKREISLLDKQALPELVSSIAFLNWLQNNHFVFLGYREYNIVEQNGAKGFSVVEKTGLGILRDEIAKIPEQNFLPMSVEAYDALNNKQALMITKATSKATVHRSVFMDYVGLKTYDKTGQVIGEKRFLGLYSASAYACELNTIPLVDEKVNALLQQYKRADYNHGEQSLLYILNALPRDELFQASLRDLSQYVAGVLALRARQRVRVFVRHEVYGHFVSLLVFVPRERYHTESRKKIQKILLEVFQGEDADFSVKLSESILARVHFIIHSQTGCAVDYDLNVIEQRIVSALSDWHDELASELLFAFGEAEANAYLQYYREGFSAAYREAVSART